MQRIAKQQMWIVTLITFLATSPSPCEEPRFDAYGGLMSLSAEATGQFYVRKFGDRHLLVTPDGHGYFALGVNHIAALGRRDSEHFQEFGRDWDRYYEAVLRPRLELWNMNSLGYDGPRELHDRVPFFATLSLAPIEKHRSDPGGNRRSAYAFPDVFDSEWQAAVSQQIKKHCETYRDNAYLIGYLWTDTPTWDLFKTRALRNTDWVSAIRELPRSAPGKQRYLRFLRSRYRDRLNEFNDFYGLNVADEAALADADFSRVAIGRHLVQEDDSAFLGAIAREFYRVVGTAYREADPKHLVFGDRYLAGDAPASVLKAAAPWIDAVAVQPGDRYTKLYPPSTRFARREFQRLHRLLQKPVLICDHAISYPTPDQPRTIFEQAPTRAEAAHSVDEFLRQAFREPYLIGYLRCQYINRPAGFGRGLRQGLVDEAGRPDQLIVNTYRHNFERILGSLESEVMPAASPEDTSLQIDLWYGDSQRFGERGHPQRWINVLGHVIGGDESLSLSYSLNGGPPKPLSVREDFKRIARDGDFNLELDRDSLRVGENKVLLRAKLSSGAATERTMSVTYVDQGHPWPLPYSIDWSTVDQITDVAQVVDGKWELTAQGVRSVARYYDRVLAIGDDSWTDYEVATSVIFHNFTPPTAAPNTTNVSHAAIALRWPGHDADGNQPTVKWYPLGATAEFRLTWNLDSCRWRIFDGKRDYYVESERRRHIELERPYAMKHRVETMADGRSRYRVKLWPAEGTEPTEWDLERFEDGDIASGSALLLTHHAEATFGNVTVRSLADSSRQ